MTVPTSYLTPFTYRSPLCVQVFFFSFPGSEALSRQSTTSNYACLWGASISTGLREKYRPRTDVARRVQWQRARNVIDRGKREKGLIKGNRGT